jgi:hypothetical protein
MRTQRMPNAGKTGSNPVSPTVASATFCATCDFLLVRTRSCSNVCELSQCFLATSSQLFPRRERCSFDESRPKKIPVGQRARRIAKLNNRIELLSHPHYKCCTEMMSHFMNVRHDYTSLGDHSRRGTIVSPCVRYSSPTA